jgi:hypothetical protein
MRNCCRVLGMYQQIWPAGLCSTSPTCHQQHPLAVSTWDADGLRTKGSAANMMNNHWHHQPRGCECSIGNPCLRHQGTFTFMQSQSSSCCVYLDVPTFWLRLSVTMVMSSVSSRKPLQSKPHQHEDTGELLADGKLYHRTLQPMTGPQMVRWGTCGAAVNADHTAPCPAMPCCAHATYCHPYPHRSRVCRPRALLPCCTSRQRT